MPWLTSKKYSDENREDRTVEGLKCHTCKNHFWVEDSSIELPKFCPWCGVEFDGVEKISEEEFNRQLPQNL